MEDKLKQAKFAMLDFADMTTNKMASKKALTLAVEIETLLIQLQDGKIN